MTNLKKILEETKANKEMRKKARGTTYSLLKNEVAYYALVMDAEYDLQKEEIRIYLMVFNTRAGTRKQLRFSVGKSGSIFYDDICETMNTDGNPAELIGKAMILHFEKNGSFQNVRVDSEVQIEELKAYLNELRADKTAREKKSKVVALTKKHIPKARYEETSEYDDEETSEVLDDLDDLDDEIGDDF